MAHSDNFTNLWNLTAKIVILLFKEEINKKVLAIHVKIPI